MVSSLQLVKSELVTKPESISTVVDRAVTLILRQDWIEEVEKSGVITAAQNPHHLCDCECWVHGRRPGANPALTRIADRKRRMKHFRRSTAAAGLWHCQPARQKPLRGALPELIGCLGINDLKHIQASEECGR